MKKKYTASSILEDLKLKVNKLSREEQEALRDNLLSFLLFGIQPAKNSQPDPTKLKGITADEKELIRKLASQTEALYRVMQQNYGTKNL